MPSDHFRLRFPASRLEHWAARYPVEDDDAVLRVAAPARGRGFLKRSEFLVLGEWKSPRTRKHRRSNSEELIRETTRVALAAGSEELKIGALRILSGVDWPTASVILHLCDTGEYPILDRRALWSVGLPQPVSPFSFALWLSYTRFTRRMARRSRCTMRELDRALWQYSKEHEAG